MTNDKHYHDDWAKTKSRDLVRDMIKRTLLTFRRPQDLKVLCLPGRDATEVHQVYDSLGIPRQNITGVEMVPQFAEEAQANAPGIRVHRGTVEDFVHSQPSLDFDVVSLDYTGSFSGRMMDTIHDIRRKQNNNHFIFHQANSVKRDPNSLFMYLMGSSMDRERTSQSREHGATIAATNNTFNELFGLIDGGGSLKNYKHSAITNLIIRSLAGGGYDEVNKMFKFATGQNYERCLQVIEKLAEEKEGFKVSLDPKDPIRSSPHALQRFIISRYCIDYTNYFISTFCKDLWGEEKIIQNVLESIFEVGTKSEKFFFPSQLQSYSYISESANPMVGDILMLSHPERLASMAKPITDRFGYPNMLSVNQGYAFSINLSQDLNKFAKELIKYNSRFNLGVAHNSIGQSRVFLGSSSRPVLTKRKFVEALEAGKSVDEIKSEYRGWENKPLPQWQAHYTMGTYSSQRMQEEAEEDSDLEKITKDQAIDLLSSGIPPEEIFQAWPTSHSLPQLRAYKAHITMGTYKNGNSQEKN